MMALLLLGSPGPTTAFLKFKKKPYSVYIFKCYLILNLVILDFSRKMKVWKIWKIVISTHRIFLDWGRFKTKLKSIQLTVYITTSGIRIFLLLIIALFLTWTKISLAFFKLPKHNCMHSWWIGELRDHRWKNSWLGRLSSLPAKAKIMLLSLNRIGNVVVQIT